MLEVLTERALLKMGPIPQAVTARTAARTWMSSRIRKELFADVSADVTSMEGSNQYAM